MKRREKRMLTGMRYQDIENMRNKIDKKLMLDAMVLEQQRQWPTLKTLDQKIDVDLILP